MQYEKKGPFEVISSTEKYSNPWISVREDKVLRPDNQEGIFGIVTMLPGVSVLPVTKNGDVFLASEYKYAISRESIEVFSGGIDGEESPEDAAKRELKEELGVYANEWKYLGCVDPFTTVINSPNHMYLANNLEISEKELDSGEEVREIRVPYEQAYNMVIEGKITHGASCVLILKAHEYLT